MLKPPPIKPEILFKAFKDVGFALWQRRKRGQPLTWDIKAIIYPKSCQEGSGGKTVAHRI
jgi:hypothetical protein